MGTDSLDCWDFPLCGFDSETTGVDVYDVENTKIVSFSMVLQDSSSSSPKIREWLLDPEIEIPSEASDVHGITTEYARHHGQKYSEGLQEIADAIHYAIYSGIVLTAYNGSFDITLLKNQIEHYGIRFPDDLWGKFYMIDPLVMDKAVDRFRKGKRTLGVVSSLYGYSLDDAHEATADVLATIHVARKILPKYRDSLSNRGIPNSSLNEIMAAQHVDYEDQAASLEEYFRKSDPDVTINKSWPFQDPEN